MIKMIELPYRLNALEPYYNRETLEIHYYTLYKGYVENTNKTQEKLRVARENSNYDNIKCLENNLSFFGSGAILHSLFFENMGPASSSNPGAKLLFEIEKDFQSFDKFKSQFLESSKVVEASGWNLLVWVPAFNKLEVLQCEKHQNLTLWGCIPILVLDMWEHSYFLQYKANRTEYIEAFWKIVNWEIVNKRYEKIINNTYENLVETIQENRSIPEVNNNTNMSRRYY